MDLARQQLDCGKYCLIPKRHWISFSKEVKICHVDFKNHWRSFLLLSLGDPGFQLSIHYIQDHYHQECKLCVVFHQYRLEFWVWASSRSWWTTGKPGVLQSMGSQRVGHNWATEQQQESSWQFNQNEQLKGHSEFGKQFFLQDFPSLHQKQFFLFYAWLTIIQCSTFLWGTW